SQRLICNGSHEVVQMNVSIFGTESPRGKAKSADLVPVYWLWYGHPNLISFAAIDLGNQLLIQFVLDDWTIDFRDVIDPWVISRVVRREEFIGHVTQEFG